jgi:hypothetical protein
MKRANNVQVVCALAGLLLIGCSTDQGPLQPSETDAVAPGRDFMLHSRTGKLRPGVDSIALLRLLGAVPPSMRTMVRAAFEEHQGASLRLSARDPSVQALFDSIMGSPPAVAQVSANSDARRTPPAPVVLALLPGSAGPTVDIRPGFAPLNRDVVVLHDDGLDAGKLGEALRTLAIVRQRGLDRQTSEPVRYRSNSPHSQSTAWTQYLTRKISEVRHSPEFYVRGLGQVRLLEVPSVVR